MIKPFLLYGLTTKLIINENNGFYSKTAITTWIIYYNCVLKFFQNYSILYFNM